MTIENIQLENEFKTLTEFYEFKNSENVYDFIRQNEKLIDLLNETKIHLKESFPHAKFELEMYYDLIGEGNDHLLLNIYVDKSTFNNGFVDEIYNIDMKILPLQKEMDLVMALNLIPRIKSN